MPHVDPDLYFTDDFLFMDPETGIVNAMVMGDEGFREANASEVSQALRELMPQEAVTARTFTQSMTDWAGEQIDQFVSLYTHAFCLDGSDTEAWDNDSLTLDAPGA